MTKPMNTKRMIFSLTALALGACGGPSAPDHSGYPTTVKEPWTKTKTIALDDNFEAKADGTVSYPRRERAKWFVLKLPIDGALEARLTLEPISKTADVGFEVLDSGFNVVAPKGDTDEEAGNPKKERKVAMVPKGPVYLHVFTLGRNDEADFKIRLKFAPRASQQVTGDFPNNLPNVPVLPQVPPSDDSPKKAIRIKPTVTTTESKPKTPPPVDVGALRGTISEFSDTGSGIKITINKGSAAGVEDGWEGYIIRRTDGKPLPGSSFSVKQVKNDESTGIVKVSMDDVQTNRLVVIKPPK